MEYYVYILANASNSAIYTGVTDHLTRRVQEHKDHLEPESYTAQYNVHKLVYYERLPDVRSALGREKAIKSLPRKKKNKLIESANPEWRDLYPELAE